MDKDKKHLTYLLTLVIVLGTLFTVLHQNNLMVKGQSVVGYDIPDTQTHLSLTVKNKAIRTTPTEQKKFLLYRPGSGLELISLLKKHRLWNLDKTTYLPPIIFSCYPEDLNNLTPDIKKKAFLHSLLPSAAIALSEITVERDQLQEILLRIKSPTELLDFSDLDGEWRNDLTVDEISFLSTISGKYRSTRATELLSRVDILPMSLIMAQAAIESSWGTSRFAREGNNLFGIWTWSPQGILPLARDEGKQHRVARYESTLDSMRKYLLTLNRHYAYENLRKIRSQTLDPQYLAEGLMHYSERRMEYVDDIRRLISSNRLARYDHLPISKSILVSSEESTLSAI